MENHFIELNTTVKINFELEKVNESMNGRIGITGVEISLGSPWGSIKIPVENLVAEENIRDLFNLVHAKIGQPPSKKIQLVIEEKVDGTLYSIEVDGKFLGGSLTTTENAGRNMLDFVMKNNGSAVKKTVLVTESIDSND